MIKVIKVVGKLKKKKKKRDLIRRPQPGKKKETKNEKIVR